MHHMPGDSGPASPSSSASAMSGGPVLAASHKTLLDRHLSRFRVLLKENFSEISKKFLGISMKCLVNENCRKFLEMSRNFIEMSRNFLDMSRIFLEISRNYFEISRNFLNKNLWIS